MCEKYPTSSLDAIKSSDQTKRIAWVLVWRNEGRRHNFGPFPDAPTANDFKAFEADPLTLFLEDLPPLYQ